MAASPRIAIIGGGIGGVSAAYELSRLPEQSRPAFTLYEATERLGGIVETVRTEGFTIECGPDSWVTEKPWARELAEELGLGEEMIASRDSVRRTYLAQEGTLQALPDGMRMVVPTRWEPLLHSPLFSWGAKLAYLREPKRAAELKDTALLRQGELADESVAEFVRRHFGPEVCDTVAGPLLSGIFGGDVETLSVRATMAPFVRMEAEHGSLIAALGMRREDTAKPIFTTLASGLETLIERMAARLPEQSLRCGDAVQAIAFDGTHWAVRTERSTEHYTYLLLATSLDPARTLLRGTGISAAARVADLLPAEASSSVVVALGFQPESAARLRIPRGFGYLVPPRAAAESAAQESLLACTFMEQKFAERAPAGGVLLRAFYGGSAAERLLTEADAGIAERARGELSRSLGPLPAADVTVVRRWPRSLPQYAVGHLSRMRALEEELAAVPNFALLGNALRGVGLGDLVRDARAAVQALPPMTRQ